MITGIVIELALYLFLSCLTPYYSQEFEGGVSRASKPARATALVKSRPEHTNFEFLFNQYGQQYGVSPYILKNIAYCESTFRPGAINGPYAGLFQFLSSTWVSNRRAMGLDANPELRYNPEEAIKTAAFKMSRDGFGAWPVCGRKATQVALFQSK